jgi:hypothetical protein
MADHELTPPQQLYEIRAEFFDEAEAFRVARSGIERQIALNHIDALLDAYTQIRQEEIDLAYEEHKGVE